MEFLEQINDRILVDILNFDGASLEEKLKNCLRKVPKSHKR